MLSMRHLIGSDGGTFQLALSHVPPQAELCMLEDFEPAVNALSCFGLRLVPALAGESDDVANACGVRVSNTLLWNYLGQAPSALWHTYARLLLFLRLLACLWGGWGGVGRWGGVVSRCR